MHKFHSHLLMAPCRSRIVFGVIAMILVFGGLALFRG